MHLHHVKQIKHFNVMNIQCELRTQSVLFHTQKRVFRCCSCSHFIIKKLLNNSYVYCFSARFSFVFCFYLCLCVEMLTMQSLIPDELTRIYEKCLKKMISRDDYRAIRPFFFLFISLYHPIEIEYQQKMPGITSSAIKCTL